MPVSPLDSPTLWVVLSFCETSAPTDDGSRAIAGAVRAAIGEGLRPVVVCVAPEVEALGERRRVWARTLGAEVVWHDPRDLLTSQEGAGGGGAAAVETEGDGDHEPSLAHRLSASGGAVHVVQETNSGADPRRDDALAASLAVRLGAVRLEVWRETPGYCTADPREVPSARLLRHLGYADARAVAEVAGTVLDPGALDLVRRARIPVHFRSTRRPEAEGTIVSDAVSPYEGGVLALAVARNVLMATVKGPTGGSPSHLFAAVAAALARHAVPVDLVVASGSEITVALSRCERTVQDAVLADFGALGDLEIQGGCATIRLVGRGLGAGLPEVAALDGHPPRLVGHGAGTLALVVESERAGSIVRALHTALFEGTTEDAVVGPPIDEVLGLAAPAPPRHDWWRGRRAALLALAEEGTPRYVYDADTLRAKARTLLGVQPVDRVLYALKANPHPDVLRVLRDEGVGFECVSLAEVERVFDLFPDQDPGRVLFTPNFAPRVEYERAFALGVTVTVDNHYALDAWPDVFAGRTAFVRVDPGRGQGHHAHVRTAGVRSKFGVAADALEPLAEQAAVIGLRVRGLHAHVGSGIADTAAWADTASVLAAHLPLFPDVRVLDLGGGLGVPARPADPVFDVAAAADPLRVFKAAHPDLELWLEPGRYLVAEAGVLLVHVTQLKEKAGVRFVGVDAGMNALVRPTLYGAYHEIVNLSRLDGPPVWTAEVVGPICESGDVLGHARRLPETAEGDVVLLATTGAYGRAMASSYNLRSLPDEVLLETEKEAA